MTAIHDVRPLPALTDANRHFWTGGADGKLQFMRCQACRWILHPPAPICPQCLSRDLAVDSVSGRAMVATYTINHQPWRAGMVVPYVVAIVELEEQVGLRLTTNIVGCDPGQVHIGMPVHVRFEHVEDVYLPLFEPVAADPQR